MPSIGYHYTSLECWEKIRVEGLIPYRIQKPELLPVLGQDYTTGIWLWLKQMRGLSHRGSILYQMAYKNVTSVVLLCVTYDQSTILHVPGDENKLIVLNHDGHIQNLIYHTGEDQAVIVTQPIPAGNTHVMARYSLLNIWNKGEAKT